MKKIVLTSLVIIGTFTKIHSAKSEVEVTIGTCPPEVFKGSTGDKNITENKMVFEVERGKDFNFSEGTSLAFYRSRMSKGPSGFYVACFYAGEGVNAIVTARGLKYESCRYSNGEPVLFQGVQCGGHGEKPSDCAVKCIPGKYHPFHH